MIISNITRSKVGLVGLVNSRSRASRAAGHSVMFINLLTTPPYNVSMTVVGICDMRDICLRVLSNHLNPF